MQWLLVTHGGSTRPARSAGRTGAPGQLFGAPGTTATLVTGSVATAPTDGTRLVTGTSSVCTAPSRSTGCFVAAGPLVLTDARAVDRANFTWFFTVPLATDCSAASCFGAFGPTGTELEALVVVGATTTSGWQFPSSVSGARYFI